MRKCLAILVAAILESSCSVAPNRAPTTIAAVRTVATAVPSPTSITTLTAANTPTTTQTKTPIPTASRTDVPPVPTAVPVSRISEETIGRVVLIRTLKGKGIIENLGFSPDGSLLVSGELRGDGLKIWRINDGSILGIMPHPTSALSAAFSPDGKKVASGSQCCDNRVRVFRVSDGALLNALEGHQDSINSVAFSPNGDLIASASWDKTARVSQVSNGRSLYVLRAEAGAVFSVMFNPDGSLLASTNGNGSVSLWRVLDGTLIRTFQGFTLSAQGVSFSPDGTRIAASSGTLTGLTGQGERSVRLWNVSDGSLVYRISTPDTWRLAFSPDGSLLALATSDSTVEIRRARDGMVLRSLPVSAKAWSVSFAADGTVLAAGTQNGDISLWGIPH